MHGSNSSSRLTTDDTIRIVNAVFKGKISAAIKITMTNVYIQSKILYHLYVRFAIIR